jgi:flagellar hook-basal body complex protein FliE
MMVAELNQIASLAGGGRATFTGTGGTGKLQELPGESKAGALPFSDLLGDAVGEVSSLEDEARKTVTGLMTGSGMDVHQAMIATEKASMAFELSLAVRNKAVQAYQQVMGMQF